MRRFGRLIANAVTLVLTLLFVAEVIFWVRSAVGSDEVVYVAPENARSVFLRTVSGKFVVMCFRDEGPEFGPGWWINHAPASETLEPNWGFFIDYGWIQRRGCTAGVDWVVADPNPKSDFPLGRAWAVAVPFWVIALMTGFVPITRALSILRTRRRVRARRRFGQCATCGYDLRASRDRCPECGSTSAVEIPI